MSSGARTATSPSVSGPYLRYFKGASDVLDIGWRAGRVPGAAARARGCRRGASTPTPRWSRGASSAGLRSSGRTPWTIWTRCRRSPSAASSRPRWSSTWRAGYLVRLLQAMHRVVRPGSRVVVETINPTVVDRVLQRLPAGHHAPAAAASRHPRVSAACRRVPRRPDRLPLNRRRRSAGWSACPSSRSWRSHAVAPRASSPRCSIATSTG